MKKKVVIIGVDGATPDLLELWMKEDKLPHLQKIKQDGTYGSLESTIPPFSAPAWASIITGCNPGKHGIYGFESTSSLESHLITSSSRKVPALWNYLTSIGLNSIIVNVPNTYPPEKIDGVMITGLLTPSDESNFTYPKTVKDRLTKEDLGIFELEQLWVDDFPRSYMAKYAPERLLNQIIDQMISHVSVTINLMKESDWDLTMVVIRGTDTAQHFLYKRKDLLLSCYQKVDELIGTMVENFSDAVFFVVSDHGFEEIKTILYPDNVLYNAGLLVPKQDLSQNPTSIFDYLVFKIISSILRIIPPKTIKKIKFIKKILFSSSSKQKLIDFSKTKAFSTADGRGIRICRKGRFSEGIVDPDEYNRLCKEIQTLFEKLQHPDTKEHLVEKIYRCDEVYGEKAKDPPDLVIDVKKGVTAAEWIRTPNVLSRWKKTKKRILPVAFSDDSAGRSGDHAKYGVFFAHGNNIKSNVTIKNANVMDVLPTVFATLDLPVPNDVDGKVHDYIFVEKPSLETVDWDKYSPVKQTLSDSEKQKIKKLKDNLKI